MKQPTKIPLRVESQNWPNISNALVKAYRTFIQTPIKAKITSPFNRQGEGLNIFLIQNKGKGPPGRSRSPGEG